MSKTVTITQEEYDGLCNASDAWEWASEFLYNQVWDVHEVMEDDELYRAWMKKWYPDEAREFWPDDK